MSEWVETSHSLVSFLDLGLKKSLYLLVVRCERWGCL